MGEIAKQNPLTPGIGVAGQVICPYMSITHSVPCLKGGCELWTELTYGAGTENETKVARCAVAWQPMVMAEQTQAISELIKVIKEAQDAPAS